MTRPIPERRPALTPALSGTELLRWYWLKTELVELARALGVSPGGSKEELTARLVAVLDGRPAPRPAVAGRASRRGAGGQLEGALTLTSIIPAGQRCSQHLREFLRAAIGPAFRFDESMRRFVAEGEGRTLGEAVEHWRATRGAARSDIAPQFELNGFLRDWHTANPGGRRTDALDAWRAHRALPVDGRGRTDLPSAAGPAADLALE